MPGTAAALALDAAINAQLAKHRGYTHWQANGRFRLAPRFFFSIRVLLMLNFRVLDGAHKKTRGSLESAAPTAQRFEVAYNVAKSPTRSKAVHCSSEVGDEVFQ
jgi:hypothetical protein